MISEEGIRLRSERILDLTAHTQPIDSLAMTDTNAVETGSVGDFSVSSQIAEINDSYERKFIALQSGIGQLKDLMLAMIEKSSNSSSFSQGQGSSKQPTRRSDNW